MRKINFKKIFIKIIKILSLLLIFLSFLYIGLITKSKEISKSDKRGVFIQTQTIKKPSVTSSKLMILDWSSPDITRMKTQGCVADGLLFKNDAPSNIKLAKESNCYFFHRAVETWLSPPDFRVVKKNINKIGKIDVQYSMFIAEAINTKSKYYFRDENRFFKFSKMCKKFSKNFWGEHTCKPSFKKKEYRSYIRQITRDAMDSGIKVFLFGQIRHQEDDYKNHPKIDNIIREMREYANSKNMHILIGAQTGDIKRERYLKIFDFIDGGIGLHEDGTIEEGPCYSKFYKENGDWCWPLMWHKDFKDKANNVITYLDWNGEIGDDMNTFVRLSTKDRHKTLNYLHKTLLNKGVGFLLPLITPLPKDESGCHGFSKKFYSPSNEYNCQDIDTINGLLR